MPAAPAWQSGPRRAIAVTALGVLAATLAGACHRRSSNSFSTDATTERHQVVVENALAPSPVRLTLEGHDLGTVTAASTTLTVDGLLDTLEHPVTAQVLTADGWIPATAFADGERLSDGGLEAVTLDVERPKVAPALVALVIDNRGGSATTVRIGQLEIAVPALPAGAGPAVVHGVICAPRSAATAVVLVGGKPAATLTPLVPGSFLLDLPGGHRYVYDTVVYDMFPGLPPESQPAPVTLAGERWYALPGEPRYVLTTPPDSVTISGDDDQTDRGALFDADRQP